MHVNVDNLYDQSIALLRQLVATPSFSKEESATATCIEDYLKTHGVAPSRSGNNVWAVNQHYAKGKPTLLLNSHHDTVKPNKGYTRDPFSPDIEDGKLYGLGSNDAGGALVSLLATFLHYFPQKDLPFNVVMTATAEEEISGYGGVESILDELPTFDFAIVGEPTLTHVAVAEKGLLVLDCKAHGVAGHAAREEGVNAIYQALPDIDWFQTYQFPKASDTLGQVKMSVTQIAAGQAHNQVPETCDFTVDIRVTDAYTLEEVVAIIGAAVDCTITPRSLRMRPSGTPPNHPVVVAAKTIGCELYGSPTTSDQALIPGPSIKMGPGDSARSHSADEFIYCDEIRFGIEKYIRLLATLKL